MINVIPTGRDAKSADVKLRAVFKQNEAEFVAADLEFQYSAVAHAQNQLKPMELLNDA